MHYMMKSQRVKFIVNHMNYMMKSQRVKFNVQPYELYDEISKG